MALTCLKRTRESRAYFCSLPNPDLLCLREAVLQQAGFDVFSTVDREHGIAVDFWPAISTRCYYASRSQKAFQKKLPDSSSSPALASPLFPSGVKLMGLSRGVGGYLYRQCGWPGCPASSAARVKLRTQRCERLRPGSRPLNLYHSRGSDADSRFLSRYNVTIRQPSRSH